MALSAVLERLSKLPHSQRRAVTLAAFSILVLRSRLLELPQEVLAAILERTTSKGRVSKEQIEQAIQQLYEKGPNGSKVLLVPHGQGISKVSSLWYSSRTY